MKKTLSKVGAEGAFLSIIKTINEKPTASIILNGKKTKKFPTKIRNKTRVSAFTTSIQHSIESSSYSNQTRKRSKKYLNWKVGSKTVIVCRWHDSVPRQPYRLHQKTTWPNKWIWQNSGIQSQYSEIKGIFCTPTMKYQKQKLGKKIPFDIATRKIKYLGINITKEVKDLYTFFFLYMFLHL